MKRKRFHKERNAWRARALNAEMQVRTLVTWAYILTLMGVLVAPVCVSFENAPAPDPNIDAAVEEPWQPMYESKPLMEKRRDLDYGASHCIEMIVWSHTIYEHSHLDRHHGRRRTSPNPRTPRDEHWTLEILATCPTHGCSCGGIHLFLQAHRHRPSMPLPLTN